MCMGTVKLSELQQPTLSLFETFTVVPLQYIYIPFHRRSFIYSIGIYNKILHFFLDAGHSV